MTFYRILILIFLILNLSNASKLSKPFVDKSHTDYVIDIIYNKKFDYIITAGGNAVKIWDNKYKKLLFEINEPENIDHIYNLEYDDTLFILDSSQGVLNAYNLKNGKFINKIRMNKKYIRSVSITDKLIYIATPDCIKVYNKENFQFTTQYNIVVSGNFFLNSMVIDGSNLIFKDEYYGINIFDLKNLNSVTISKKNNYTGFIKYYSSKKLLIYAGLGGKVHFIYVDNRKKNFIININFVVKSMDFYGEKLYVGGENNNIIVIDLNKRVITDEIITNFNRISSIKVIDNGQSIVLGSSTGVVRVYSLRRSINLFTLGREFISPLSPKFLTKNKIISGYEDGVLRIFDMNKVRFAEKKSYLGDIESIAINKNLIAVKSDNEIKVLYKFGLKDKCNIDSNLSGLGLFSFLNNNVLLTEKSYVGLFQIWDLNSCKLLRSFSDPSYIYPYSVVSNNKLYTIAPINTERQKYIMSIDLFSTKIKENKIIKVNDYVPFAINKNMDIVIGDHNGSLEFIKINFSHNQKKVRRLIIKNGHSYLISSIDIDKDFAISASFDKTIKLWDIKSPKELISAIVFSLGQWLVITPEGYFTGTPGAAKYLNITKYTKDGMEPFDFSQLYDHFFRPDLVKLKLNGDEEAYQKAIAGMTYKEALKNPPPKVAFEEVDHHRVSKSGDDPLPIETDREKIRLTFSVKQHDGGGVGIIRVYQEGKLIKTIGKGRIKHAAANVDVLHEQELLDAKVKQAQKQYLALLSKAVEHNIDLNVSDIVASIQTDRSSNEEGNYTVDIELKPGDNEISIEAFNKTNTVSSFRKSITVKADIPLKKPNLYAIVVGVNHFKSPSVSNLRYSVNDANAIKTAVEKKFSTVFDKVEVSYLVEKNATKQRILQAAAKIARKAKVTDTVLFFISTHGRAVKGRLFLVPHNNEKLQNWIDFEEVFQAIQQSKALNQIFVVDACESGKANDIVSSVYDSRASVLAKGAGVHVFLATTKGTYAFESQDPQAKHSVFTQKILKVLHDPQSDLNSDGQISVKELAKRLTDKEVSSDYQYPVIRSIGRDISLERIQ